MIKKVKVLSYNETNKKFDAQSVIISNIADATDEYDAINFSCLKKYIDNNIEYKIIEIFENIKEIKKIIYNTDIPKEKIIIENNNDNDNDILQKIKTNIFEFNIKHKDILDKFLYYEKKNEYVLKCIEGLEDEFNLLEKNILEKKVYKEDKESLKKIFFDIENKFNEKINYMSSKYNEINKLYSNISLLLNELTTSNYADLNEKIKKLEIVPDVLNIINTSIESLINFKDENNLKIEKLCENNKNNEKEIKENLKELQICKNIIKEFETKISLFDIDIIKNKKDIDFLDTKIKNITNPTHDQNLSLPENFLENLNKIEKKFLVLEKLFNEEKKISTNEYIKYIENKTLVNENIENIKKSYEDVYLNLENYKKQISSEFEELNKNKINESLKQQENINLLISENINNIKDLKDNINNIKNILNDNHEIKKNEDKLNLNNNIENINKDYVFIKQKLKKYRDINKVDFNLLNSIVETIKEDIIKINKIILENNSFIESLKEEFKKINNNFNLSFYSNVKEFIYEIPIQNNNNNFIIPSNLSSFLSFSQKQFLNKFIDSTLLKFYTKIEFKNNHNIIIPINTNFKKENIKINFIKNNKEIINFIVNDFEDTNHNVEKNTIINFPLNLSIKPNNLKECINLDYFIKRNNLKSITIKILGVVNNYFN